MSDTDSPVSAPDEAPNLYAENVRLQVEAFRLRANNERLRAALREIAKVTRGWEPGVWSEEEGRKYFASLFFGAQKTARAALEG